MKKKLVILLTVVALMLSLCSCAELDKLKDAHAVVLENGNISYKNAEYKKIDDTSGHFAPCLSKTLNITEPDVPVLFSDTIGYTGEASVNDEIIMYQGYYFCRLDVYDYVKDRMMAFDMTYDTYSYDYSYFTDGYVTELVTTRVVLTKEQNEKLKEAMANSGNVISFDDLSDENIYFQTEFSPSSEDGLFNNGISFLITRADSGYYITWDPFSMDESVCSIPSEYTDVMEDIMGPLISNNKPYDRYDIEFYKDDYFLPPESADNPIEM